MDNRQIVYLSPSGIAAFENCPRSYMLERIMKVRTQLTSCSIGFGSATGRAWELYLLGLLRGQSVDPVAVFREEWRQFTARHAVRYTKGATAQSLDEVGARLMEQVPDAWRKSGFTLLLDVNGEPMLERKLKVDIGNGVILVTKLDLMVLDEDGETVLLDNKATASESSIEFTLMSDQLTAYNLALKSHASRLGIEAPRRVGYWEMLRKAIPKSNRGEGPVIRPPLIVNHRSDRQIAQFVAKTHKIADLIRARRFEMTPRMSYNSPCSSCSLVSLCARRETEGLVFESPASKRAALELVA